MNRRTCAGLALSVALLVAIVLPAAASALTAKYDRSGGLTISAAPGERNRIEAGFFGAPPPGFLPFEYVVRDDGAPVVASSGCKPEGSTAKCNITGIQALTVDLADGADNSFRFFGGADVKLVAKGGVDDVLSSSGFDLLDGGGGNDRLRARDGSDILRGGEGDDELVADDGDDLLDGGLGTDRFDAGPGEDELLAREGVRDIIDCGAGKDTLAMDLKDGAPPASCETVDKSDRREAPNVRVLSTRVGASRTGVLAIPLACPRAVRRGCAGTLSVAVRSAGTVKRRYTIRRARRARVGLRLGAAARRALARRGRLRARLVSVERGVRGPKTTIRPLVVRRGRTLGRRPRARSGQTNTSLTVSFGVGLGLGIKGTPGVRNNVGIKFLTGPTRFLVRDDAAPIAAGAGCEIVTVISVSCRLRGPRTVRATLGDRDDKLKFELDSAGGADAVLDGGTGFDRLEGADGYDVLLGGTADGERDTLEGKGGNDALFGGPGNDTLTGGLGNDYVTGDDGADRLFLRDGFVDRWCDSPPVIMEQYNLDGPEDNPPGGPVEFPGDTAVCPADEF